MSIIQSKGKITGQLDAVPQAWDGGAGAGNSSLLPNVFVESISNAWRSNYVSQLNGGIAYGSNSLPGNRSEFAPYLGGPTSGIANPLYPNIGPDFVSIGNNVAQDGAGLPSVWPPVSGQPIVLTQRFLLAAQQWTQIRRTNWRLRVIGGSTIVNVTGVSYLNSSYAVPASSITQPSSAPVTGNPIVAANIDPSSTTVPYSTKTPTSNVARPLLTYMQDLVNNVFSAVRDQQVNISVDICHVSCHSSCHGSRSRR